MYVCKKNKITFVVIALLFVIVSIIYYRNFSVFKNNNIINCSILLYDTEYIFSDNLICYQVIYDKNTNRLKVLSINTDVVLFKKYRKSKSLKTLFFEDLSKGLDRSVENFYVNLQEAVKTYRKSDFYIHMSVESLISIMSDASLIEMISRDEFLDKYLKTLNKLDFIERTLKIIPFKAASIIKKYNLVGTNISKISFLCLIAKLKMQNPLIMFCELPVKYIKMKVEADTQNIDEFLNNIYYIDSNCDVHDNVSSFIDVKNASGRSRMAQKVAWLLRENKFDVLGWSNFKGVYKKTLIISFDGDFKKCIDLYKILNAGKILITYNDKMYYGTEIFVGQDCTVYDNFDKIRGRYGKN